MTNLFAGANECSAGVSKRQEARLTQQTLNYTGAASCANISRESTTRLFLSECHFLPELLPQMLLSAAFPKAHPSHPRCGIVRIVIQKGYFLRVMIAELRNAHKRAALWAPTELNFAAGSFSRVPDVPCWALRLSHHCPRAQTRNDLRRKPTQV